MDSKDARFAGCDAFNCYKVTDLFLVALPEAYTLLPYHRMLHTTASTRRYTLPEVTQPVDIIDRHRMGWTFSQRHLDPQRSDETPSPEMSPC